MSEKRYFTLPEPVNATSLAIKGKPTLQQPDPNWKPPKKPPMCGICGKNYVAVEAPLIDDDPWDLIRYLMRWVIPRPEWQKGVKAQRWQRILLDAVDEEPGTVVAIPADMWRKLRDTLEDETDETGFELPWPLAPQIGHFADVIIDATDKEPETAPAAEAAQPVPADEEAAA